MAKDTRSSLTECPCNAERRQEIAFKALSIDAITYDRI